MARCPECGHSLWPEYMDAATAAQYLSLSKRTIEDMTQTGRIPSVKYGPESRAPRRYPRRKLDEWADSFASEAS